MERLISSRFIYEPQNFFIPSVSESQFHLINLVKSKLDCGEYKLQSYECPCGTQSGTQNRDVIISEIDRYGLPLKSVLCMNCGTVRIDPYLDEGSLQDFYTHIYRKMYGMDMDSGSYDSYFSSQSSYAEKVLAASESFLKPESWVCEVGCGAGGALKVFQSQGYNVAGCDYDTEVLELGRQRGIKNLYYGSLNAIGNSLGSIKFDLIYLHHVFEHVNAPLSFLKECRNYLTPGGKIIVIVPDINKIDEFGHPPAVGNLLMYLHIAHKYNFSIEGLQRLCHRAGYSAVKLNPNLKMKTPWSMSPELWAQMTIEVDAPQDQGPNKQVSDNTGADVLKYLERTEKLYSLGLCKGQVLNKIESMNSPQKFVRKIQQFVKKVP